ncbi:MAG: YciI family protein [Hyphomonadaceae bacterium]|nr:YciI family protein [Hyphomonadaceae bacterium]
MRYLILIYGKESDWADVTPERGAEIMSAYYAYTTKLKEAGVLVVGDELQVASTGKSVRGAGGASVVDGPFLDTKEQLGGYYLIECADEAEALKWAKQCPAMMHGGGVELRPVVVR